MTKEITVEPQVIRGFRAFQADAEFYKKVAEGAAEKFVKGSQSYKIVMSGINTENGTGSQFFFNTEAGLYLPEGQRVARFDDLSKVYGADSTFFRGTYCTVTPELVLRTDTPSRKNNTQILENLIRQVREIGLEFSPENPLVLSGLELARDDNGDNYYGILVQMGDNTIAVNDSRFAYGIDKLEFGNQSRTLWTKEQGLSEVVLYGSGEVGSSNGGLDCRSGSSRVIVFDTKDTLCSEIPNLRLLRKL